MVISARRQSRQAGVTRVGEVKVCGVAISIDLPIPSWRAAGQLDVASSGGFLGGPEFCPSSPLTAREGLAAFNWPLRLRVAGMGGYSWVYSPLSFHVPRGLSSPRHGRLPSRHPGGDHDSLKLIGT